MSIEREANSYIAVIGAYERDNFGDTLFLEVSRKLLEPWQIVPLSIISRNMNAEGGGTIISASAWFDICDTHSLPKAIIVIGGEVLTCPVIDALSCDLDPARASLLHKADQSTKMRLAETISWHSGDLAYVPDMTKIMGNGGHKVPLALNSVGGSSLKPRSQELSALLQTLDQAKFISVRDSVTHQLILNEKTRQNSLHLNPDIVSTIKESCAPEVGKAYAKALNLNPWLAEPYLIFQANDEYIRENNPQIIGEQIAETASALKLSVVFQPAGIAPGHDSFEMLDKLSLITNEHSGGRLHIHTQRSRDVWTQVAVIAHAACFVGTSLHGRIVSAAYGRPRVSLINSKVRNYASTWEEKDLQPFDVSLEKMKAAIEIAMSTPPERLLGHAERQAQLALDGFARLKTDLHLLEPPENIESAKARIRLLVDLARFKECEKLREAVFDIGFELSENTLARRSIERKLSNAEHTLSGILQSPSWRLTKPLRALRRLINRA